MQSLGLYIHVPFCKSKCPYCDFYSVCLNSDELKEQYTNTIIKEIYKFADRFNRIIDSIYFGGGTPTLLGHQRIYSILSNIYSAFKVDKDCEITIEANPNLPDNFSFSCLQNIGLNRVSLGAQSFNQKELALLGRKHNKNDVVNAVDLIKKSKIDNISLDLMLGIQRQTQVSLRENIDIATGLDVSHISAYLLKIEKNTVYYKKRNELIIPDDDEQAELFMFACDYLSKKGFRQYEISNFSIENYECLHNLKYWNCDDYIGVGPSAHSCINGVRFFTPNDIKQFNASPMYKYEQSGTLVDFNKLTLPSLEDKINEYVMLRLRCSDGIAKLDFEKRFGIDFPNRFWNNAKKFEKLGYLEFYNDRFFLTVKGFLISNIIISEILYS